MAEFETYDEPAVRYHAPRSLAETFALLEEYGDDAKLLAGGQSLLVLKRMGLIAPKHIIGLRGVAELRGITRTAEGGLRIGAMETHQAIEQSPIIRARYTALAEAAELIASPAIRRRGTIGGNVCHADPTSDPPAALMALDAMFHIASREGTRSVLAHRFFVDYMEVDLAPGELLVAIELPARPRAFGSAYIKHRVRGVDTALVGVAVSVSIVDGRTEHAGIGIVGAAPTPHCPPGAEMALVGEYDEDIDDGRIDMIADIMTANIDPVSDTEGSAWYREQMVEVIGRRAVRLAMARARALAAVEW